MPTTPHVISFLTVKKLSGQRAAGDVAHLQTHQASQEGEPWARQDPSTQVPPRHICVSCWLLTQGRN